LATIGVNTEKAILEELNAEIRRSTEATVFTENKLRSWLAFFLSPVRNVISASGFGKILVTEIKDSSQTYVSIYKGDIVVGTNGKEYEVQNDLSLFLGVSTPFTFVQGSMSIQDGTYNDFIAIPIKSGMVDLSYTKVFMEGVEVPPVPFYADTLRDSTELFGVLHKTMEDAAGDVDGITSLWDALLRNVESLWQSVQGVSIRPRAGFFPFFFNDTLFIKIFSGGVLYQEGYVPDPTGKSVEVHYRISDGAAGNLKQDQLTIFNGRPKLTTEDDGEVSYTITNSDALNGVNAPSRAELVNLLRRRFFASTHVSSIPEYTAWFLSQPQIGDCLVVSDFERWRLSGKEKATGFDIKGVVDIYLVDVDGNPIVTKETSTAAYTEIIKGIDNKLEGVRDIAFLEYKEPRVYHHFFKVQYRSVSSEAEFLAHASSVLSNLYSLLWVRSNGSSLFRDLDMESVTSAIHGDFNVSGLRVFPYHYYERAINTESSESEFIDHFSGEKDGGWYEYWEKDSNGDFMSSPHSIYREFVSADGTCSILRYNKKFTYDVQGRVLGWVWSTLYKTTEKEARVGSRRDGKVSFDTRGLPVPGVLRCFWSVANEGLLPVGNNLTSGFGIRKLPGDPSLSTASTFFGESVRFEKII
jgi:hypothetical protein